MDESVSFLWITSWVVSLTYSPTLQSVHKELECEIFPEPAAVEIHLEEECEIFPEPVAVEIYEEYWAARYTFTSDRFPKTGYSVLSHPLQSS